MNSVSRTAVQRLRWSRFLVVTHRIRTFLFFLADRFHRKKSQNYIHFLNELDRDMPWNFFGDFLWVCWVNPPENSLAIPVKIPLAIYFYFYLFYFYFTFWSRIISLCCRNLAGLEWGLQRVKNNFGYSFENLLHNVCGNCFDNLFEYSSEFS